MGTATEAIDHPFVRKIEGVALFDLSHEERAALQALPIRIAEYDAGRDVVAEHDRPNHCFAVLDGIAAAYKTTDKGRRLVVAYYVPGDMPDFQGLHLEVLDFSIGAVTPLRVGFVSHSVIRRMLDAYPRLGDAFWRMTLIEGALSREWMLNNGRRESLPRMAHLFCELMLRMNAVGLVVNHSCRLPLTQYELGDALGISTVHVNRVLKDLRDSGMISLKSGRLTIHDWEALSKVADFDPSYLHLRQTDVGR